MKSSQNKGEYITAGRGGESKLTDALRVVIVSIGTALTVCPSELWFAGAPSGSHFTSGCGPLITPAGW